MALDSKWGLPGSPRALSQPGSPWVSLGLGSSPSTPWARRCQPALSSGALSPWPVGQQLEDEPLRPAWPRGLGQS